jgi:predicted RNA binding protein YcfA (HicA-like mRNA interferase family)
MGALRPIKPSKLLKILQEHYGYSARQGRGDHVVLFDQNGHHTVIQMAQKELRQQIISMILKQTNLKWEDIERYL